MSVMKRGLRDFIVFTIILTAARTSLAYIPPISDMPVQTIQGYRSSPPYGWTYAYDVGFSDLELNVEIDIRLVGADPGEGLLSAWETGIENMWSRKFDILDETQDLISDPYHYHVNFDVVFPEEPASPAHHTVTVVAGQGSGNMLTWYTTSAWGSQYNGAYVAHEVGHMFSLYDEYPGGAQNPANPIVDYGSIMGSLAAPAKERHYEPFLNWLEQMVPDRDLSIGKYDPTWEIPEPSTPDKYQKGISKKS
jgi:hypothetical protein